MTNVLILYDEADTTYHKELTNHLKALKQDCLVLDEPLPGDNIGEILQSQLTIADAVLFLVSSNSLANDGLNVWLKQAIYKHELGHNITCAILIGHCVMTDNEINKSYILPDNGDFAPTNGRAKWWRHVILQLRVLLRVARLQQELKSKEGEIAFLREKYENQKIF